MSISDRPDGPLAPWQPDRPPAPYAAAPAWDEPGFETASGVADPPRKFSLKLVLRAIRRHWWQILLIWVIASGGAMTLIYAKVKPTFDATAYVRFEQPRRTIIGSDIGSANASTMATQLETQALRMATPDVLGTALKEPNVAALPRIRAAIDPEAMLRKELRIAPVKNTEIVTVSMSSLYSAEAVTVVNAVADSYKTTVAAQVGLERRQQTQQYEDYFKQRNIEVQEKERDLHTLVDTLDGPAPAAGAVNDGGNALDAAQRNEDMTIEEFKALAQQLNQAEMFVQEAEAALRRSQAEQMRGRDTTALERLVDKELKSDPELASLINEHAKVQEQLDKAGSLVHSTDLVYRARVKKRADLKAKYTARAAALRPVLRQQLEKGDTGGVNNVELAKERLAGQEAHRDAIKQQLGKLRLSAMRSATGRHRAEVDKELRQTDLNYTRGLRDRVKQQLDGMQLDLDNSNYRVYVSPAKLSNLPTSDSRKKMLLAAPVAVLLGVVGLFTLLELAAGRVGDPDDLQGRLNLGVIGVVPPLPSPVMSSARGALPWIDEEGRRRRRAEEFVQSLDHLRVQLWSGRRAGAGHRCVLITSASVSEGKTTLAAQLAGRCANAGLSTLLIDADLRRPALAKLLEVPIEPGFADVLAGVVEPEAAMTPIGNAGGFFLMPAGRVDRDPGRLLGLPTLAALLARLRETFDIIIVDAPPVLPVPDALILGRHTDGAVLAVRHDASRFPLVERAKQKLASVGIPALGVVINGVRGGGVNYGNYAYSAATAAGPDGPA